MIAQNTPHHGCAAAGIPNNKNRHYVFSSRLKRALFDKKIYQTNFFFQ